MDSLSIAINYLSPHGDSFWRWSPDIEALEWSDGTAIAFYEEIHAVVETLGTRPLPPFEAIVILLAACQYNWKNNDRFQIIVGYAGSLDQERLRTQLPDEWRKLLLEKLDGAHTLLREKQGTADFKRSIAERFFESRPKRDNLAATKEILEQLQKGIPALVLSEKGDGDALKTRTDAFITSVRCLLGGDLAANAYEVQMRIDTGLSEIPEPTEFEDDPELPDVERLRRLLNYTATTGEELGGIAQVAQDLMAAVHLPRAIAEPDLMPLGGFSDISNRGPLDRLLITELAHDDETLAVRVALNEALYLRRESPPKTPQRRRALLIDTGIRLWGVPRVFAISVALALAATAEKLSTISAYRTNDGSITESDLLTREGLIEHLKALDPLPHPADAAIEFLDLWDDETDGVDPVLVTHAKVLTDPKFRQRVRERLTDEPLYVATVDNAGRYELHAFTAAGQKLLQQAKIDLDKLIGSGKGDKEDSELLRDDFDPDLPSILSMSEFPLRTPHQFDPQRSTYHPDVGVVTHTRDGRLLLWDKRRCGARILSSEIPRGKVVWVHIEPEESAIHLLVQAEGFILFTFHLNSGSTIKQVLRDSMPERVGKKRPPFAYCHHHTSLFILYDETAEMYSIIDGHLAGSITIPHAPREHYGRFFRVGGEWHSLSGDLTPQLEKINPPNLYLKAVVESPRAAAPIGVLGDGRVILLDGSSQQLATVPNINHLESVVVADDRETLGLVSGTTCRAFDIASRNSRQLPHYLDVDRYLTPEKYDLPAHNPTPHIKFQSIDVSPAGRIHLITPKGITYSIQLEGQCIILRPLPVIDREGFNPIEFEEIDAPGEARYRLQRATWPCGSRAYLDARGFLHIVSFEAELAEVTFALRDGMLSGWTTENRYFGQNFYIEPHAAEDAGLAFVALQKITARIHAHQET